MLKVVDSQLLEPIGSTGSTYYMAILCNQYDVAINILTAQISLASQLGQGVCPITAEQLYISNQAVFYPSGQKNTVLPKEEMVIMAYIHTDNAPTSCPVGGVNYTTMIVPSITVSFEFASEPPSFTSSLSRFPITYGI
jgi:hypothetical protein